MMRRLAAILAADVVGYSSLMGADEAGTLARLKACKTEVIEPTVASHGGRIVKRMGDGYLVEFASVVAAIECAMAWQAAASAPIAFRIGVNLGDVIVQDGDLFGDGVNIAARLEALAEPGGICLSDDAWRHARGKVEASFEDLGAKQLKNIAEPVHVFRLVTGTRPSASTPAQAAPTTWRLPKVLLTTFRHLGAHGDAEALAAGVTETLAAALAHFEEFALIDPRSAGEIIAARGVQEAGRLLGATYVLEGSLQLAGGKARIGVQLIDADSGQRVWSHTLDRGLDDAFALQDDLTAMVASTLGEAVAEEQARAIARKGDADQNAYEMMVRGLQHLHRLSPEDNPIARDFFERAIALKPDHYYPTLCICWTYLVELSNGWPPTRVDALHYSLGLVRDVLRRHDRSAQAHRLMGRLLLLEGDHDQALAHSERAHQLNPYHADIIMNYGLALMRSGRTNEGLEKLERALAINPYAPAFYKSYLSIAYFFAGRPLDGLEILRSVEGRIGPSRIARIANLTALGRVEEAQLEARIVLQEDPSFDLERLIAGYALKSQQDRALLTDALLRAGLPE